MLYYDTGSMSVADVADFFAYATYEGEGNSATFGGAVATEAAYVVAEHSGEEISGDYFANAFSARAYDIYGNLAAPSGGSSWAVGEPSSNCSS